MSLDKSMATFGFAIGTLIMASTNTICKLPPFRRPWLHVATGAAVGYMFGSIPRLEKWVLKENERILGSMERRQKKQNAIYEKFQARLAEADALMAQDPVLLAHKEEHSGHELKFYRRY